MKQVLLNLLSNAVKFTPEGGRIDVRAELVNGTAEISVTDTGIGIAPEDQEAVFEEFRQVGKPTRSMSGRAFVSHTWLANGMTVLAHQHVEIGTSSQLATCSGWAQAFLLP